MRYLIILLILASCTTAKKDQRAVNRVLSSRQLIDKIYPAINELYPCIIDTVIQFKPGKIDTLISVYVDVDTIVKRDTCTDKIIRYTKTLYRTDTVIINKVDQRQHLKDLSEINTLKGAQTILMDQLKASQKYYRYALILIGILVSLFIIKIFIK